MKNIVIIGAGGFGREVAWLIDEINKDLRQWNLLGFIDENKENYGKVLNGIEVLGGLEWFQDKANIYYICAIGNSKIRQKVVERCSLLRLNSVTLVHPKVIMSPFNKIGEGCIICAGNILTVNITIGNHVIINLDCTIGHDVVIEDFVTILPNVSISGNVAIGLKSEIGTGTSIIQHTNIGKNTIVGAGAVVIRDLPDNCIAVGVPAKPVKKKNNYE